MKFCGILLYFLRAAGIGSMMQELAENSKTLTKPHLAKWLPEEYGFDPPLLPEQLAACKY